MENHAIESMFPTLDFDGLSFRPMILLHDRVLDYRNMDIIGKIVDSTESISLSENDMLTDIRFATKLFSAKETLVLHLRKMGEKKIKPTNFDKFNVSFLFNNLDIHYSYNDSAYQILINSNSFDFNRLNHEHDIVINLIRYSNVKTIDVYKENNLLFLIKIECEIDFGKINDWSYKHTEDVEMYISPDYLYESLCCKKNVSPKDLSFCFTN